MRNISAAKIAFLSFVLGSLYLPGSFAEGDQALPVSGKPEITVTESSKPVFDPEWFDQKTKTTDDFFLDLREELKSFSHKQQDRKLKFLKKVREKNMDPEQRQEKILSFNQKEQERLEKFHAKQKKKIKKYYKKRG